MLALTHLPIALSSAIRFLIAGGLLALMARVVRREEWPRRLIEWRHLLVTGFLMVFVSNGLNAWAMQFIATNESALLNGTSAFWIAGLGVFGPRGHPLTRWAILGLAIGFSGQILILLPEGGVQRPSLLAELGVLAACLAFSVGTLYYRSVDTKVGSLMFMGMQLICGGLMLVPVAMLPGDTASWTYNSPGLIALSYLTLMSSCLGFTAYG